MIFLTVGTQFPFDRLVKAVDHVFDKGLIEEEIFAQIGDSSYKPRNFRFVSFLNKKLFDELIRKASMIISHAGIGAITISLENRKPLLIMPRLKEKGEVVNNHQMAIAKRFESLGYVLVAYRENDLSKQIENLKTFVPKQRQTNARAVADRIDCFLTLLDKSLKTKMRKI